MLELDEQLKTRLDEFCKTKRVPNIIFHGSSGSGKKTIVKDFISRIYEHNRVAIKENVLFINCSQGKGIKYIREELKTFAKYNIHVSFAVPFKSIVMLNFDALSIDAQSVMRRIIELFINTRFFIIVENKYKLLNPIISRFCSIYVAEHFVDDVVVNLHQIRHTTSPVAEIVKGDVVDVVENIKTRDIMNECLMMYEKGVSCMDLVKEIEGCSSISAQKKTEVWMRYYILKKEYRCEKLLMLHVLTMLL
jgi:Cdc6-like AAA superfamily ATPase